MSGIMQLLVSTVDTRKEPRTRAAPAPAGGAAGGDATPERGREGGELLSTCFQSKFS